MMIIGLMLAVVIAMRFLEAIYKAVDGSNIDG